MTEHIRIPAPDPIGDVVPGEPPVPITVWYVPAAAGVAAMSLPLAQRLVANFTHRADMIFDVTDGPQMIRAAISARRRIRLHAPTNLRTGSTLATLIVFGWPAGEITAEGLLAACAARLDAGGCAAVVITSADAAVYRSLIGVARTAGLTYLQHIVAAHTLTAGSGSVGDGRHLRVHTDVLIFAKPHDGQDPYA